MIELGREEAGDVNQDSVDTEHLLLALLREPDGVASHVLRNLGVKPDELRAEALKARICADEDCRAYRAARAGKHRLETKDARGAVRSHDGSLRARDGATRRSGGSTGAGGQAVRRSGELTRELRKHAACAMNDSAHLWNAGYSIGHPNRPLVTRCELRCNTFWLLAIVLGLVTLGVFLRYGWIEAVQTTASVFAAILLLTPPLQFAIASR